MMGVVVGGTILKKSGKAFWLSLAGIGILANLPDVDFLFGFVAGSPNLYHRGWTHSLGFVLIVMAGAAVFSFFLQKRIDFRWIRISGLLVFFHLILDLLTMDRSAPYGIQFFWPLSRHYVISPLVVFRDVEKSAAAATFITSLFSRHNGLTVLSEIVIFAPWVALRHYTGRFRKPGNVREEKKEMLGILQ